MIAVSAVSLLLVVTLTAIILTLMIRMRRSIHRKETYTATTKHKDVPVSPNEAYAVHKMTNASEDVTYKLVQ